MNNYFCIPEVKKYTGILQVLVLYCIIISWKVVSGSACNTDWRFFV